MRSALARDAVASVVRQKFGAPPVLRPRERASLLRATSLLQAWLLRARLRLVDLYEMKKPPGGEPSG
jgi:hypothetical protein